MTHHVPEHSLPAPEEEPATGNYPSSRLSANGTRRRGSIANAESIEKDMKKAVASAFPFRAFVRKISRKLISRRRSYFSNKLDGCVLRADASNTDWHVGLVSDANRVEASNDSAGSECHGGSVLLADTAVFLTTPSLDEDENSCSSSSGQNVQFSEIKSFAVIQSLTEMSEDDISSLHYDKVELKKMQGEMAKDIKLLMKLGRGRASIFLQPSVAALRSKTKSTLDGSVRGSLDESIRSTNGGVSPAPLPCDDHGLEKYALPKPEQQQRLSEKADVFVAVLAEQSEQRLASFCTDNCATARVCIPKTENARLSARALGKKYEDAAFAGEREGDAPEASGEAALPPRSMRRGVSMARLKSSRAMGSTMFRRASTRFFARDK